ncbi:MAG: HAD family hydrolase [Pseudonocardiaceae bacterium]
MRPQAVLFDLDGVLTDTAAVHKRAWEQLFTEFLGARRAGRGGAGYTEADYYAHIDGKPRLDGVRALLASRDIDLPDGAEGDTTPEVPTVHGLAERKNQLFLAILRDEGVQTFAGSAALVDWLGARRVPMGIVSSSRNARAVLARTGLRDRFEIILDGDIAAVTGLAGKPAPDTYLHAAALLHAAPEHTVVVEDASSGVRAGRAGGFRVVGVDRGAGRLDLLRDGADIVVDDLVELIEDPDCTV